MINPAAVSGPTHRRPATASAPAYALGLADPGSPGAWYLARSASAGNMIRTASPWTARTWATVAELELFLAALPAHARDRLAGRTLLVVPLDVAPAGPAAEFMLRTDDPANLLPQSPERSPAR